jgi:uncharacterized protein
MRWNTGRRSENVEDQRRIRPAGIVIGGGIGALILAGVTMFRGGEPQPLVGLPPRAPEATAQPAGPAANPDENSLKDFVSAILGDTEDVWREQFVKMKREFKPPRLVLFTGSVQTACGLARSAVGPFYCPTDEKIYIDLSFFQEMKDRYHAPGDFARAYVIAHEVGHHVQKLLGISEPVRARQQALNEEEARALSVRLELQADFLAGAWAHHAQKARQILEPGDVDAALKAVTALGDDRPDLDPKGDAAAGSFTRCWDGRHGTSAQRVRWFTRGLKTGDLAQGDTIKADEL